MQIPFGYIIHHLGKLRNMCVVCTSCYYNLIMPNKFENTEAILISWNILFQMQILEDISFLLVGIMQY